VKFYSPCVLLLAACSTIDHSPAPSDWPKLKVNEHYVSSREMRNQCVKYTGPGESPMACAEIDLDSRKCDIWLDKDFLSSWIIEHERMHCAGHDHIGGTTIQRMMEEYRAGKK